MLKGISHYAFDTVYPFVAAVTDRSHGVVDRSRLTGMSMLYVRMVNKALFDQEGDA